MNYYLTFDAGTQSVKVAIYDEKFQCVAVSTKPTTLIYPQAGWVEMNVDEYVENIKFCMRECHQAMLNQQLDPQNVKAIMGDGIICGVVGINEDGQAITPYINYLDSRTLEDATQLTQAHNPIWGKETGNPDPLCMFPALHARWLLKNNQNFQQNGAKFVHNAPYILMKMGNLKALDAFIDWGTMSGWGLGYKVMDKQWSVEQLAILNISPKYMPKIVTPWSIVGNLSEEFSQATGFPVGIPICAGAGDTMQSMLGCGIFEANKAVDVAGTCAMFCISTNGIIPELSTSGTGLIFNSGTIENTYFYWGFVRTGGLALRWFRDSICQQPANDNYYTHLSMQAANIAPGCNGVFFLPYLTGEYANSTVRGCFINMTLNTNQATLWRSVLEAIAYDYKKITDICKQAGLSFDSITITEGGSKDILWNQMKADILATKTRTYKTAGGALLMNAITAAHALQKTTPLKQTVQEHLVPLQEFIPDLNKTALYEDCIKQQNTIKTLLKQDI